MKKINFIYIARDFRTGQIQAYDPSYDQYPLNVLKMVTVLCKAFVVELVIMWSYFNNKKENKYDDTSVFARSWKEKISLKSL